ncbi:MAG: hypothetical protein WD069_18275 [Planctomycetales bacterium]
MDKLQPLLTHKFWVLFGLALVLPVGGWWFTTATLQAEYEANAKTWDGKIKLVRDTAQNAAAEGVPNEKWVEGMKQTNETKQQQLFEQRLALYKEQDLHRKWPQSMLQANQGLAAAQQLDFARLPYRARIPDTLSAVYRPEYRREIDRIRSLVEPFTVTTLLDGSKTTSGLVLVRPDVVPVSEHIGPTRQLPTTEQIWDAEEDLWLLESIMQAIRKVNGGAASITSAQIREISELKLLAGYRPPPNALLPGQPGAPGAIPGLPAVPGRGDPARPVFMGRFGPNRDRTERAPEGAGFDPIAEFGDPTAVPVNDPGGLWGKGAGPGAFAIPGGMVPGQAEKPLKRYVDDGIIAYEIKQATPTAPLEFVTVYGEELPYRTRGFYLRVTMAQREVPALAAALSNMPWKTQIVRMNMVASNSDIVTLDEAAPIRPAIRAPGAPGTETDPLLLEALGQPDLAEVAIAGLITIYLPPTQPAAAGTTAGQPEAPAASPAAPPASGGPASPAATVPPAAAPADPAASPAGASPGAAPGPGPESPANGVVPPTDLQRPPGN